MNKSSIVVCKYKGNDFHSGEEEKERNFKEILKRLSRERILEESEVFFNIFIRLDLKGKGLERAWWIIVKVLQEHDNVKLIIRIIGELRLKEKV